MSSSLSPRSFLHIACLIAWLPAAKEVAAQNFALHDGDCVVFYGDSITALRFYTKATEEFMLTRYPALHVQFVNAGVPGDTVFGGYAGTMAQRVQNAAATCHPTMVTIMLGMNDGGWGYTAPDKMHADFMKGYTLLLNTWHAVAPSASITLINPTPYDEITHGTEFPGYSRLVAQLSADVSSLAAGTSAQPAFHVYRADFQTPVSQALFNAKALDPQLAALLIPDRIHPAEVTHWIMAGALMRAWHADPIVSEVVLDGDMGSIKTQYRAAVSRLIRSDNGIQWDEIDEALPLPLDLNNPMTKVMLESSDVAALDQQMLTVSGLPSGTYQLAVDTKIVGTWTNGELSQGVNLALFKTPMLDQANSVAWLEGRRMTLDEARFILGAEIKPDATTASAQDALARAEGQMTIDIREKLAPKVHKYELRRKRN